MDEEWRPVVGYEGLYEVSCLGRVRSLARVEDSGKGHTRIRKGKLLSTKGSPYPGCSLYKDGVGIRRNVHILVAEAFIPNPETLPFVLHWDDDPSNSRVENLRWGTGADNNRDAVRNGRNSQAEKTHCPQNHPYSGSNLFFNGAGRLCRQCHRNRMQRLSQQKLAEDDSRHGTLTGYLSHACRCEPCRAAGREQRKRLKEAKND